MAGWEIDARVVGRFVLAAGVVAAAWAFAFSSPALADRPTPPTAEQVDRATKRFLEGTTKERQPLPRSHDRRTGGVGADVEGELFPDNRVVSFYGAPQMGATILGRKKPRRATRRLRRQARPYRRRGDRPVVLAFDLVAVIATASAGSDGKYRTRQPDDVIRTYLRQVRRVDGRLVLDIQPGRSTFLREVKALRKWIAKPSVDVGLDPEWNVGRKGVPGRTTGKVSARNLNRVSRYLNRLVGARDLPPKLMLVHQFRRGSIRKRGQVKQRPGVQALLNFDGIGSPAAKRAGYAALSRRHLFDGFSLFYLRDTPLMGPGKVLRLRPPADYVMYQ